MKPLRSCARLCLPAFRSAKGSPLRKRGVLATPSSAHTVEAPNAAWGAAWLQRRPIRTQLMQDHTESSPPPAHNITPPVKPLAALLFRYQASAALSERSIVVIPITAMTVVMMMVVMLASAIVRTIPVDIVW